MNMAERMIRPAKPEDMDACLSLRREFCQQAYKGFDILCNLRDDQEFAASFQQWLDDPAIRVSLLYLDDVLTAFSAYRMPEPVSGEILDLQYLPGAAFTDIQALAETIIKEMEESGASYVQVWVLRDNLRARFHYQQFGFKPVGGSRETVLGGASLSFTRYVYCLKDCLPDCI